MPVRRKIPMPSRRKIPVSGRRGFFWEEPKSCPKCCPGAGGAAGELCRQNCRWQSHLAMGGGESSVRRLCPSTASWGRDWGAPEPSIHPLTRRERVSYTLAALKQRADITF